MPTPFFSRSIRFRKFKKIAMKSLIHYFQTVLFWLTRPIASLFIYTGSIQHHFREEDSTKLKAARDKLIQLGGDNLILTTKDGRKLDGMFFLTDEKAPTVICCLGNAMIFEKAFPITKFYIKQGINIMLFNYGGYGNSEGTPSVQSTYADVEAAYHYLKTEKQIPDKRIIVHGVSIGGGPATHLASLYPIDLVLDRTYARLGNIVGGFLGMITDYLYPYDNVAKIKHIKGNIHIVEASDDKVMGRHHVKEIFQEILRTRHKDAFGSEIDKLRSHYITEVPTGHTDTWLQNAFDLYSKERRKFKSKVLDPLNTKAKQAENLFKKLWSNLRF